MIVMERTTGNRSVCYEIPGIISHTESIGCSQPGGLLTLRFEYCADGPMHRGGFCFHRIRAYRFKAVAYCEGEDISSPRCRLVKILASDWVRELNVVDRYQQPVGPMKHYLFYYPDFGCYEVVAQSWSLLSPDE